MTTTKIFAITILTTILLLGTSIVQAADHGDAPLVSNDQGADISAIPPWVDNNFKWYGEGKITQTDLLNGIKHLMDNNLMHLSDKAAQEVSDLREENTALKKKLDVDGIVGPNTSGIPTHSPEWTDSNESDPGMMRPGDEIMVILYPSPGADMQPEDEIMVLLRPSPGADMQPEDEIMVLLRPVPGAAEQDYSFVGSTNAHTADDAHKEWIDILNIDMASHRAGSPDSFFDIWIEPEASSGDTSTSAQTITFTGLESASETVHDLVSNGETSTTGWEEGVAAFTSKNYGTSSASTIHELLHGLGMMDNAIEKEIQKIQTELDMLEELHDRQSDDTSLRSGSSTQYGESDMEFIQRHASQIDDKILSIQTGLDVLEEKLVTADSFSFGVEREMKESGEKGGTADINIGIGELQEAIQKQHQTMQMMSNISKSLQEIQTATFSGVG